jgi:hypothetical protein
MLAIWGKCREDVKVALTAGLAAMALAVVLVAGVRARPLGFLRFGFNLSQDDTLISAYPDVAVSADGEWVAAVWTDGYQSSAGYKGHAYLRAASSGGVNWGDKIPVFTGSSSACASDAAVAISGDDAHVAYVVFQDTCDNPTQIQVRYAVCSLADGQCQEKAMAESVDTLVHKITWVDLALDAGPNPHLVWAQYDADGENGDIRYRTYDTGSSAWGVVEDVAVDGDNNIPAIAWADERVQVVWQHVEGSGRTICYQRRDAGGWLYSPKTPYCFFGLLDTYAPENPDVGARAGRLFVVWDQCSDPDHNPDPEYLVPCSTYRVMYRQWDSSLSRWSEDFEVGTNDAWNAAEDYDSLDDAPRSEYVRYLRPAVALNADGWPAVVWHAHHTQDGGGEEEGGDESYAIHYSYALSGTVSGEPEWITTTVLGGDPSGWLGSAAVGVGTTSGEQRIHVAYMGKPGRDSTDAWDVYYHGFSHNPTARINAPGIAVVGSTVTLDGSASYDPQGLPLSYSWSLTGKPVGSAATLTGSAPESRALTVDVLGYYTVTLEVATSLATSAPAVRTILASDNVFATYLPVILRQ